jgi:hypothetical protein
MGLVFARRELVGWACVLACVGCLSRPSATAGDGGAVSPIRLVQTSPLVSLAGVGQARVQLPAPVQVGDTVVVYAWTWTTAGANTPPTTLADDQNTTYVRASATGATCVIGLASASIYYATVMRPSGTGPLITYVAGDAGQQIAAVAIEYHGVTHFAGAASGGAQCPSSPCTLGTTDVATAAPDALLASVGISCANAFNGVFVNEAPGFKLREQTTDPSSSQPGSAGDEIVHGAGAYHAGWTIMYTKSGADVDGPGAGVMALFD